MKAQITQLSMLTGPSGWEDAVRDLVACRAASLDLHMETDGLGNLTVWKRGRVRPPQPVVLSAHLDEPGMMVKSVAKGGFLKFGLTGDTDPRTVLGKTVAVGERSLPGIVGLKPIHLTPPEERKSMPKTGELYLDIGAPNEDWACSSVCPGDYAVFVQRPLCLGEHMLLAKAMSRSMGCAVLLALMSRELPVDVCFSFSTQRHVGCRGTYGAAARLRPGLVVALDICPGEGAGELLPLLGGGPVIPAMDKGAVFDRKVVALLKKGAETAHIPVQIWADAGVGGEGGVWQRSCGGAQTAVLYCPAKYCTAPAQVIDSRDTEAMVAVICGMLTELEGQWI